jgi:hypothetical protein
MGALSCDTGTRKSISGSRIWFAPDRDHRADFIRAFSHAEQPTVPVWSVVPQYAGIDALRLYRRILSGFVDAFRLLFAYC